MKLKISKSEKLKALKAITAYRQLDALNMLSEKEKQSIHNRILKKYEEHLNPLRLKTS